MEFTHEITLRDGSILDTNTNIAITQSTLKKLKWNLCERYSCHECLMNNIYDDDKHAICVLETVLDYFADGD